MSHVCRDTRSHWRGRGTDLVARRKASFSLSTHPRLPSLPFFPSFPLPLVKMALPVLRFLPTSSSLPLSFGDNFAPPTRRHRRRCRDVRAAVYPVSRRRRPRRPTSARISIAIQDRLIRKKRDARRCISWPTFLASYVVFVLVFPYTAPISIYNCEYRLTPVNFASESVTDIKQEAIKVADYVYTRGGKVDQFFVDK